MKLSVQRTALNILLTVFVGCSAFGGASAAADGNNKKPGEPADASQKFKNAATLRFGQYVDQRNVGNPRLYGQIVTRVYGVSGNELLADQDVAVLAAEAIKKRFDAEGYQVLEGGDANNAVFEVSGVIKELAVSVKHRDEISISIETTLKDAATGKVVWSGLVTEKNDRFAGVSGSNKKDVDDYLNKSLLIVGAKTAAAINESLVASRPELFNMTPGTKAIKGVDVYVAPTAAVLPAVAAVPVTPAAAQANTQMASATGLLSVNTNPSRAKVYLDGVYFGLSPLRSEVEPGVHDVVVKLKGYKTATEKVSVRKGDKTELELSLER